MDQSVPVADFFSDPISRQRADALANDLAADTQWDLLSSLFWVACRSTQSVAWLRVAALGTGQAQSYIQHPDAMADFDAGYARCEDIQVYEMRPSFMLHRALAIGGVDSFGLFPGELEPRSIRPEVWKVGSIGGGLFGKNIIGSCIIAGCEITSVLVNRESLQASFPHPDDASKKNVAGGRVGNDLKSVIGSDQELKRAAVSPVVNDELTKDQRAIRAALAGVPWQTMRDGEVLGVLRERLGREIPQRTWTRAKSRLEAVRLANFGQA